MAKRLQESVRSAPDGAGVGGPAQAAQHRRPSTGGPAQAAGPSGTSRRKPHYLAMTYRYRRARPLQPMAL